MTRLLALLGVLIGILSSAAESHEVRPGYLELRQTAADTYDLLFKVPALSEELRLGIYLSLPRGARDLLPARSSYSGGALIERRTIMLPGLAGQSIGIDGLSATVIDVLVRLERMDGTTQTERLTPTNTSFPLKDAPGHGEVARTYLRLGVEHILFGIDHLLFVLALIILVRTWRRIAVTVTAFTVAHSITLAAATLGFVHLPGPPVEAAIALSIALVAGEIVNARRYARTSLAVRWPWIVSFAFGLLHGLGFAGALAEVGLPQNAIPLALLFFNLGVEVGQLAFVAVVMVAAWAARRIVKGPIQPTTARIAYAYPTVDVVAAYAIGAMATYWLIDRTAGFWS